MGLWTRFFTRRKRMMESLDDDIRDFIERETQDNIDRGLAPEEARYAALRKFGNVTRIKEETRDVWTFVWLEQLWQDIRFAVRTLCKNPGFAAVAVLTLALGIGANTAIFSVVDGVLLAPLPYAQPNRLVVVWESNLHYGWHVWISYLNFRDWQRDAHSLQGMAAFYFSGNNVTSPGTPEHVDGKGVSSGFFDLLGEKLTLGREFTQQEDRHGGAPVAIISSRLWRDRFSRSPRVLGQSITLGGVAYTVIGVAPPDFHFYGDADVYTPLGQGDPSLLNERSAHDSMLAIARLAPGVTMAQAQAEMSAIQSRLDQLYPDSDQGLGTAVVPLKQEVVGSIRGTLLLLLGAVGLVLLIACANVANLLLARATARGREFAIRFSLGAGRARVVLQLLTESVLLSLVGGGLGLLLAIWAVKPLLAMVPGSLPRSENVGLNIPVLLFALGVAIAVGILFGLLPALKNSKANLQETLKEGGRAMSGGHHRAQSSLVVLQMALSVVLLAAAGLLLRTIHRLWDVNPGFDARHLVTFKVGISPALTSTASSTRTAYRQLLERIRHIPGVEAVDFTSSVPVSGQAGQLPFWVNSRMPAVIQTAPRTLTFLTGPDYLRTIGIPLLQGRYFTAEDTNQSPCVVAIDSVFARTYFPGTNPVGETLTFGFERPFVGPCRIIGVVGHVKNWGLADPSPTQAQTYYPLYQDPDQWVALNFPDTTIVIRTPLDAAAVMPAIKGAVYGAARGQPVYNVQTMQEIISQSMAPQSFPLILLGAFAGLALLLAAVGIYGVISYSVNQRVHEIGIRMALGAERFNVLSMVLGQGAKMALLGIAIGLAGAMGLTHFMASFLFGVSPRDPLTLIGVAAVLILVSLAACYLPARRATKVDPMVALRYE